MSSTAPEPLLVEVESIEVIRDDENQFPPTPVATIKVNGTPHQVTLDSETMRVDYDAFSGSGLPSEHIDRINDALEDYEKIEQIEPALTQSMVEDLTAELGQRTGVEFTFQHFSGDQYELRKIDENDHSVRADGYNSLGEAFQRISEMVAAAPEPVLDMTPDVVEPVHAGIGDVTRKVKDAVAAGPLGKPHSADGQQLSAEVVDKTLALMLKQLDAEDEKQVVAVKR